MGIITKLLVERFGRLVVGKKKTNNDNNWKDEALIDFFDLNDKPEITTYDLANEKSLIKKWIKYQEWKERVSAYEEFTGKKWR